MKRWIATSMLALAPLATAHAAGGGGVTVGGTYMPRFGSGASPHTAPGLMPCVGGIGYAVFGKGVRVGGDGAYCWGKQRSVQASYGGVQLGAWRGSRFLFWSAYAGLGGGVFNDASTPNQDAYRSIYLYAKPTISVGMAMGPTAVEFGLYAMVPVNVIQDIGNGVPRGYVTPNVGAQVSFMFGWFKEDRDAYEVPAYKPPEPPPPPPEPVAPPPVMVVQPPAPTPTVCPPCNCDVDVSCGDVIIGGDVNAGGSLALPYGQQPQATVPEAQPPAPTSPVPESWDPWLQWYDHGPNGDHPAEEPPCVHPPYGPDCPQSREQAPPRTIPEVEASERPLAVPVPR